MSDEITITFMYNISWRNDSFSFALMSRKIINVKYVLRTNLPFEIFLYTYVNEVLR